MSTPTSTQQSSYRSYRSIAEQNKYGNTSQYGKDGKPTFSLNEMLDHQNGITWTDMNDMMPLIILSFKQKKDVRVFAIYYGVMYAPISIIYNKNRDFDGKRCIITDRNKNDWVYSFFTGSIKPYLQKESQNDTQTSSNGKEIKGKINRLVMISPNKCMLCDNKDEECKMYRIGRLYGWIYCSQCEKDNTINKEIVQYFKNENMIPMEWIFRKKKDNTKKETKTETETKSDKVEDEKDEEEEYNSSKRIIKFYRESKQKIVDGYLTQFTEFGNAIEMKKKKDESESDELMLTLVFKDNNEEYEKSVSLRNIFYYNPDLYKEIKNCDNLLNYFVVSYNDISDKAKEMLEKEYELSQKSTDGKFTW